MKKQLLFILILISSTIKAQTNMSSLITYAKENQTQTAVAAVVVGCLIVKPSLALLPLKILLLPFKLVAAGITALGTLFLVGVAAALAVGGWKMYPHWKEHKNEILAQWHKHKPLIEKHISKLVTRGKHVLAQLKNSSKPQTVRPELPSDVSLLPDYRA